MNPKTKTLFIMLLCFALCAVSGYVAEKYYVGNRTPRRPDASEV